MRFVRALVVVLAAVLTQNVAAQDWPEFRGAKRDGVATVKSLPLEWNAEKNIAWKVPVGEGWSSPVVVKDRIYLTAAIPVEGSSPTSYQLSVLAMNTATGSTEWTAKLFQQDGAKAPKIHGKNSHASPTPIVANGRIYVHFGHMGTACLDLDGKPIWTNEKIAYEPVHGNGGSPILVGKNLIFSCDGANNPRVVSLDIEDGHQRWETPRPNSPPKTFAFCTPALIEVDGKQQVISVGAGCVCAYEPDSGKEIWHVNHGGYSVIPRPVFAHGLLYVSTSYDSPVLLAIKPDGEGDVTDTHVAWSVKKGAPHTPSLLVVGDELYMVSDAGVASCLDAKTGEQIWQKRVGGNFSASPLYACERIYFQDEEGTTHVVAAGREYNKLAENKLPERTLASYAVTEGVIYLRGDKHLYRIEEKTEK